MSDNKSYWFPVRRYGWGWGLPGTWQGWAVLISYMGALLFGSIVLKPHVQPFVFGLYVGILSVLLLAVCWVKGEPPRWRWGGK